MPGTVPLLLAHQLLWTPVPLLDSVMWSAGKFGGGKKREIQSQPGWDKSCFTECPAGLQGRTLSSPRPHSSFPKASPKPSSAPAGGVGIPAGDLREGRERELRLSEQPIPPPLASVIDNNTITTAIVHIRWALVF